MKFHLLFEQSGTFKNVFKEFGNEAFDYDILNDYGQTDFQIDLFKEIEHEYDNIVNFDNKGLVRNEIYCFKTIFSDMKIDKDFIIAFFPCTYFTDTNEMCFKGMQNCTQPEITIELINRIINRDIQRSKFYQVFLKFCCVVKQIGISTIIENPTGMLKRNYLRLYSPIRPKITDANRTKFGDRFIKSTDFYPINFDMKETFVFYEQTSEKHKNPTKIKSGKERSEISPLYAKNFYKRFIQNYVDNLKGEQND